MLRFTQLFTAALVVVSTSAAAVVDLTPSNFDSIVLKSGKPALVEFFAPWCGHCKTLAPIYEELAGSFASSTDKITIAKVDADEHKSLGTKYGIKGFPTIKYFDGSGKSEPEDYKKGRDIDSLTEFIAEKIGVKPKGAKKVASSVEMLNDSTFDKQIGGDMDAIVAFTAPWCGHCKSLAPIWETVAADFASEPSVLIAKVDADAPNGKKTAERYEVRSYPTILYFPKGSKDAVPYTGGRTEADLVTFMNEKAGTFRSPGGGLNALAGVIPSLDEAVAALKTGGEKAYKELAKQAGALQDKTAEYYAKVASKAENNAGYLEKEYTRLQNLIGKGNLAPEKLDDLISRKNILSRFIGQEDDAKSEL
ncbi:unnamed protein product [Zymoseptoria tritici ST99CH_3D1]|nr:unnamed protein product [Zymoseptoria tritici ST99CH_3D1]